jgi:hypothetical protein
VHVLENAARVVGDVDPEVLVHPRIPLLRQVVQVDATLDQLLLELEAQDDVHVVRHLVRVDPDQRRVHLVDCPVKRFLVDRRELRERLLEPRVEVAPERTRTADEVLPRPAL